MTRQQLLALGLGADAIDYRVKHARLHRVHPGVYAVGRPPITPLEHAMAAVLACGPDAVLSHGSAMTLWGLWKRWDRPFETTVIRDRRPTGVRVHRARHLHRHDVRRQLGIPATSAARTLLDMAHRLSPRQLKRAVKDGQVEKIVSADALAETLAGHPHHPGAAKLRPYLDDPDHTRSRLEDRFLAFCRRHRLPRPQVNVMACGFEVDALFTEQKVIVELDSWSFHSSRESFEDDRDRDGITTMAGFATVRITWRGFEHQSRRLLSILARRQAA